MAEGRCKRHPKHRNSKGVCPSCLRERLQYLSSSSSSSSANPDHSSTSSSSLYTSDDDDDGDSYLSSLASTPGHPGKERNSGKMSLLLRPMMAKSRSIAVVLRDKEEEERETHDHQEKNMKKKKKKKKDKKKSRRFWSKLLAGSAKRSRKEEVEGVLVHSKTMKENSSTKWAFFS